MALFDAMFQLSGGITAGGQAITDSDAASEDIIDFTLSDLEMGGGQPYWLNIRVGTAFAGGTNIVFSLRYDTVAPIDSSSTVIWQSAAITTATLVAGYWVIRMPLPVNVDEERIVGLFYDVTGTMSAGTINAWLDNGPQSSHDTQVTTSNI